MALLPVTAMETACPAAFVIVLPLT
jgi:hypothetical protein